MKMIKQFLFSFLLFVSANTVQAQITSADAMVQQLVATLKAKDEKAFVALHPNKEQMMRLVGKMIKGVMAELQKSPEAMKELKEESNSNIDSLITASLMQKASPQEMAKLEAKYIKEFNAILKKGEEKGINWNDITLTKANIDTVTVADEAMMKMFGSDKFRTMQGVLHFTSKAEGYQLSFNKVMFLPEEGGWYGISLKQVAKEGEKLSPTYDDVETKKVELSSMEDAPPPPPPPPAKSKQKTKTTKTKTKS